MGSVASIERRWLNNVPRGTFCLLFSFIYLRLHSQLMFHEYCVRYITSSCKRKALTDFIARTGGAEKAFIEKKLGGGKAGKTRLRKDGGFELPDACALASIAGQSKVGMVRARLRQKAAGAGCSYNLALDRDPLRREQNRGEEAHGCGPVKK